MAHIERTIDGLAVITPYDGAFLTELKRVIPANERRWKKPVWLVDSKHETVLINLVQRFFRSCPIKEKASLKTGTLAIPNNPTLKVEYIGACKARDAGESSAFGWANGDWNIILSETALRQFFNAGPAMTTPNKPLSGTLYSILGISADINPTQIKSAYRRAARQWHPDINDEPDAKQMFQKIAKAYEVLSDPKKRKRYDAGLRLEAGPKTEVDEFFIQAQALYRAPFTCGLISFTGKRQLGRWVVGEILSWKDILNDKGQVMVSSWDKLSNTFKVSWVDPEPEFEVAI